MIGMGPTVEACGTPALMSLIIQEDFLFKMAFLKLQSNQLTISNTFLMPKHTTLSVFLDIKGAWSDFSKLCFQFHYKGHH